MAALISFLYPPVESERPFTHKDTAEGVFLNKKEPNVPIELDTGKTVLISGIFAKDFPRSNGTNRRLYIGDELVVQPDWKLTAVVSRLFHEIVGQDENLLITLTEEAAQSGWADLMKHMLGECRERLKSAQPVMQDFETETRISREDSQVRLSITVKAAIKTVVNDLEIKALDAPFLIRASGRYLILADRVVEEMATCDQIG